MKVRSVTVSPEAVEAVIAFPREGPLRTSEVPGLTERALLVLPGLRGHRCDNDAGLTFADELPDTELAHLVEHATLEIMALAGSPATLRGSTTWDFARDGRGVFHVRLDYDDDLVCMGALACACDLVRAWAADADGPDVRAEARRLRGLRRR